MKSKILYGIIAAVVAFALWLFVVTVVSPEFVDTIYDIPVELTGENVLNDRGLMLLSGADQTVTLKLEGNRSDLTNLSKANITLLVDLTKITTAGTYQLPYNISYPGIVEHGTPTVLEQLPRLITVEVAELEKKDIPVQVVTEGKVAEGHIVDRQNITLDTEIIHISGPKDVIDRIDHARIIIDLTDKSTTISGSYRYTLCDVDGKPVEDVRNVTTSGTGEVAVTIKIQKLKEVELILDKIFGAGVTEDNCIIEMNIQTIQVSGTEEALAELDTLLLGTLNLAEMLEDQVLTFPIILPEGVTCLTGETEVTVTVTFQDLEIREYAVTNFVAMNVPEGLEANLLTKKLSVRLRGTKALLDAITAEDISIEVDFSKAEEGTTEVYVPVILVDAEGPVGAIGKYEVVAEIRIETPPAEEPEL